MLQGATDDLKPAFCANDLSKAMQTVESCYARVDKDASHQGMNQCVIEDLVVMGAVKQKTRQLASEGAPNPYADSDFMNRANIKARVNKYPNFIRDGKNSPDQNAQKTAMTGAITVTMLLKQEKGCYELDKLK